MKKGFWWKNLATHELLNVRLCDLDVTIENTVAQKAQKTLYRDLERKGLKFKPHIWVSDDWFCPDGIPGFAVPFFILHPRLQALEKEMMGNVEGKTYEHCLKLFRHETGHAIENAFYTRRQKERQKIFGLSSVPYPEDYDPNPYSKKYVRHLEGNYAQSHPDEDFAETFALWLTPKSNWRKSYENWPALIKLTYMQSLMNEFKGKRPVNKDKSVFEELCDNSMTLREYYENKINKKKNSLLKSLNRDLTTQNTGIAAVNVLRNQRKKIVEKVAQTTQLPKYKIDRLYAGLIDDCKHQKLSLKLNKRSFSVKLKEVMLKKAPKLIKDGEHRISM